VRPGDDEEVGEEEGGPDDAEDGVDHYQLTTSWARQQAHETLDGPEELPNVTPMMELEAGTNVWYQAYVLRESLNEALVRFPREYMASLLH